MLALLSAKVFLGSERKVERRIYYQTARISAVAAETSLQLFALFFAAWASFFISPRFLMQNESDPASASASASAFVSASAAFHARTITANKSFQGIQFQLKQEKWPCYLSSNPSDLILFMLMCTHHRHLKT